MRFNHGEHGEHGERPRLATTGTTNTTKNQEKPPATEAQRHRKKQEKSERKAREKQRIGFDFLCVSVEDGSGFRLSLCLLCSLWLKKVLPFSVLSVFSVVKPQSPW
jgi:hypothetical protein